MTRIHWERSLFKIGKVVTFYRRRLYKLQQSSRTKVSNVLTTVYMARCRCHMAALRRRLGVIRANKVHLKGRVRLQSRRTLGSVAVRLKSVKNLVGFEILQKLVIERI